MALQFPHSLCSRERYSTTHGFTKVCLQHGLSQSVQMAGLPIRLAFSGSSTSKGTLDLRQLAAKGCLVLTTMKATPHQNLDHSVKAIASFSSGCHLILHTFFNHWTLAALAL